jgi:hypothetical protein
MKAIAGKKSQDSDSSGFFFRLVHGWDFKQHLVLILQFVRIPFLSFALMIFKCIPQNLIMMTLKMENDCLIPSMLSNYIL